MCIDEEGYLVVEEEVRRWVTSRPGMMDMGPHISTKEKRYYIDTNTGLFKEKNIT